MFGRISTTHLEIWAIFGTESHTSICWYYIVYRQDETFFTGALVQNTPEYSSHYKTIHTPKKKQRHLHPPLSMQEAVRVSASLVPLGSMSALGDAAHGPRGFLPRG